jgi:AraC-like DNA-binding protein
VNIQYIPDPKYADTVCAFRKECSQSLNTEVNYVSTGWTLWQISDGEIEYSIEGYLQHGYAHHVLLLAPRDKIRIHFFSENLTVSVLCVPESLMNSAMRTDTSKQKLLTLPVLLKHGNGVNLHHAELNNNTRTELHHIFSILIGRVPPAASLASIELAMPLVEAMVLLVFDAIGVSHNAIRPESRMEKIATGFMTSLPSNYLEHQDVAWYAAQACVSVKYFTAVVKNITSTTPSEWINRMLTIRARELLWLTDKTVNEISDELKFSSPSVFIRFFKKRIGCTPRQYKDKQKQKHEV